MTFLTLLGSTGSIGTSTLDVVRRWPDRFGIFALVAGRNTELLARQIAEFRPQVAVVADETALEDLRARLGSYKPQLAWTSIFGRNQTKRRAGSELMSKVKYISSSAEIPAGQSYVLVIYGEEYGQMRNSLGLTITVARNKSKTINDLTFLTAVHSAKEIAKREGISTIFACK